MKSGPDTNKIFAALLMAALIAALSGFLSRKLIDPHFPKEKGYAVAVMEEAAPGAEAAAPKEAEPIDDLLANADTAAGEKVSRVCTACHSFDKGGPNRVGPNLSGVVGRPQASHEGFAYSDALKKLGGRWSEAELNKYLFNPKAYAPGNKMVFGGLSKKEDRANLIGWLRTLK